MTNKTIKNKSTKRTSPKISIIVPVYNVEKYLPRCLDSLINQTLKDIEIICINDGSKDNCDKILEKYNQRDNRIIILNQKNSGQGSARNRGLEIARGKYIQFLDSDDFYEPNCCEEMYNLMEKYKDIDIACFDTNIIYDAYEELKASDATYLKMHFKGKIKVKPAMAYKLIDVDCWNKIFRKTFIDDNNLKFPEKLQYEDVGFYWFCITRANYIYFYRKKLTNYLRHEGSFLGEIYTKTSTSIFDTLKVRELIYNDLQKNNKWKEYKKVYIKSYLSNFRWLINCFKKEDWSYKKIFIDKCASFLSQFDIKDIRLCDNESHEYNNIIKKNYYLWNAFENYEIEYPTPKYTNAITICFNCDKNYIPYLSITLQSIIENSSLNNNYDIVILYQDISYFQKYFILSMCRELPNISIRFFNMAKYIKDFNLDKLFTTNHLTISAYFRLFVGKIFSKYKKILYLDCDLVLTRDVAELFLMDIKEYPIAAVPDVMISNSLYMTGFNQVTWKHFKKYMKDNFNFSNQKTYFNSGVMIIDIGKFNNIELDYLINLAQNNTKFFHDQNVLNVAFQNNYYKLPTIWNFPWDIKFHSINDSYKHTLPNNILSLYEEYDMIPAIIHYTSHEKPWKNIHNSFANIWWEYARKTPFYEEILMNLMNVKTSYPNNNNNFYNQFKYHHKLERIFSIKGLTTPTKKYKVVTIFGIKIKFRKDIRFIEYILSVRNEYNYKILRILGFKIKFKRKKRNV
ncbi:glycosyltransferase [bacterium]|nr:glycosyltransferase [bacterium]